LKGKKTKDKTKD